MLRTVPDSKPNRIAQRIVPFRALAGSSLSRPRHGERKERSPGAVCGKVCSPGENSLEQIGFGLERDLPLKFTTDAAETIGEQMDARLGIRILSCPTYAG